MFEAYLPVSGRANESYSLNRVGWSHGIGRFQGLAVHPLRDEVSRVLIELKGVRHLMFYGLDQEMHHTNKVCVTTLCAHY